MVKDIEPLTTETPACVAARGLLWPRVKDLARAGRRLERAHAEHAGAEPLEAAVHKVRVAARRAGVVLRALRACLDDEASAPLRSAVKRIRRSAGIIRDADVQLALLATLGERTPGVDGAALTHMANVINHDRAAGFERLWKVLARSGGKRLRNLGRRALRARSESPMTLAGLARTEIDRLRSDVERMGDAELTQPAPMHDFRLALKRLRYGLETFEACVPEAQRSPLAAVLEQGQRIAGEANDLVTLDARLEAAIAALSQHPEQAGLGIALTALRARLGGVAELRRRRLATWWAQSGVRDALRPLVPHTSLPVQAAAGSAEKYNGASGLSAAPLTLVPEPAPLIHPPASPDIPSSGTPTPAAHSLNGTAPHAPSASQRNLWLSGSRLAVIDIGSNSIRLLAVELTDERQWKPLAEERAMTRLAQGLGKRGHLCTEAMARSVEALGRFKAIAERLGTTTIRAFATAAVREALNRDDFLSLVHDRTALRVELVSALEEGMLTHRSVTRAFDLSHGLAAVVDIGGGSMEVVFSQNGVITENTSMPLGAVRLTEQFGGADAASGAAYAAMRRRIEEEIRDQVREHEPSPAIVVGCGGTFTTLLTLAAAARGIMLDRNSPALSSLGPVSRAQLKSILKSLRSVSLEQRLRVPGLPSDRADIVVAGFTAVERLLKHLDAANVHVHPGGFREGLLMRLIDEEIASRGRSDADSPDAALLASARALATRCGYEAPHSEQVARLSLSLFDQLKNESDLIPGLGSLAHERALLEAAAVLHDVGTMVEYRRHHKHSQTIIRHADLRGWSARQRELVAMIARYHRRADPTMDHADFAALTEPDRAMVRRLAAILRVADGLDRSHSQPVSGVRVRFGHGRVHLEVRVGHDATVELKAGVKKSGLLAEVIGTRLDIGLEGRPTPGGNPP